MTFGFIIIRHVNSSLSDQYWKECYTCIRRYHDEPIVIVDDSSNRDYLVEDLVLVNTTVIYDKEHKGAAELLPYFYFHQTHPFDTAIILHDSVFLQKHIDVDTDSVKFVWTYPHAWDDEIFHLIEPQLASLPHAQSLLDLYRNKDAWNGPFGVMTVITWQYLDTVCHEYHLWDRLLPRISARCHRNALERTLGVVFCHHLKQSVPSMLGIIHHYMPWDTTFAQYRRGEVPPGLPLIKVWSGR